MAKAITRQIWLWVCVAMFGAGAARADEIADFYHGKNLTIIVGYTPGGGYDAQARILAKYFNKYIPGNPTIIVQNMPGAGTIVAANFVNNTSPRDGSVIGMYADMMIVAPLLKIQGVQFDPRKFGWIGSLGSRPTPVVFVRSDAPATTFEQTKEIVDLLGADGPDATSSYAYLANDLFGTKFKVVMGYAGGTEIMLAIERGEVHGRAGYDWPTIKRDKKDWIARKFISVVLQLALEPDPDPDLKDVPLAINLAKTEEDRQILDLVLGTGKFLRSFSAPAGVPPARLKALQDAFAATMKDPGFIADIEKVSPTGVDYASPQQIEAYMNRVYALPQSVVERGMKYFAQ